MERCSRWGEQERDRMEIFLGSHYFLLIMKHTPPPLFFPASAVLSIRKTEKLSDGVTALSGTVSVSHVSVKQRMLQSLMSRWKLILALRSSILSSKDRTLASRILGRGGLWALFLSLLHLHYIYIYAFSRRFYPKRLTIAFMLYIFISTCVPWESNPQPFALLTQCSTTEPHRNMWLLRIPARLPRCFLRRLGLLKRPSLTSVLRSISNGHAGSVDKVSWSRLVQWCPMSKSVLLSYIKSADVMRVKRESKNT